MRLIKLTNAAIGNGYGMPTYVNVDKIVGIAIGNTYSSIVLDRGTSFQVQETEKQIMDLVARALNGPQVPTEQPRALAEQGDS